MDSALDATVFAFILQSSSGLGNAFCAHRQEAYGKAGGGSDRRPFHDFTKIFSYYEA
jgi:hypothetical protein